MLSKLSPYNCLAPKLYLPLQHFFYVELDSPVLNTFSDLYFLSRFSVKQLLSINHPKNCIDLQERAQLKFLVLLKTDSLCCRKTQWRQCCHLACDTGVPLWRHKGLISLAQNVAAIRMNWGYMPEGLLFFTWVNVSPDPGSSGLQPPPSSHHNAATRRERGSLSSLCRFIFWKNANP